MRWLRTMGARFAFSTTPGRQAFESEGKLRFWGNAAVEFRGGGRTHVDRLLASAAAAGVDVWYGARGEELIRHPRDSVTGIVVRRNDGRERIGTRAVVLASGGFEASREKRAEHLGPAWRDVKVRGTEFNTGDGIRMALDVGARPYGQWSGCHSVAWDVNAPPTGDWRVRAGYMRHSYPFGIVVNSAGVRFLDEGADFRNYTYAKYGAALLDQPGGIAFQIFDRTGEELLRDDYGLPETTLARAGSVAELASRLGIPEAALVETVRAFNAAASDLPFDPTVLDGKHTVGLEAPKSNWAVPIGEPPFLGFPVTCGITFTYGGLRIERKGRVLDAEDRPIPGLTAAGELVGGLFYHNYPGGAGLAAGSVFGRIAGRSAALTRKPGPDRPPFQSASSGVSNVTARPVLTEPPADE